jgi:ribosomal protein S18 acetylase RimI-like enzyme
VRDKMRTGAFFVVDGEKQLDGCVYLETADRSNPAVIAEGDSSGYIGMLAVDPARQGRGLGRRLMLFGEEELRRGGCTRVQLRIINLRTELVQFYGKLGYRETGTAAYPRPESLSQPVHFVNLEKSL